MLVLHWFHIYGIPQENFQLQAAKWDKKESDSKSDLNMKRKLAIKWQNNYWALLWHKISQFVSLADQVFSSALILARNRCHWQITVSELLHVIITDNILYNTSCTPNQYLIKFNMRVLCCQFCQNIIHLSTLWSPWCMEMDHCEKASKKIKF